MIKFVLIDLDDTIFDFSAAERAALAATLTEMGIEPTEQAICRYSEINHAHWQMLERGELTREQVLVGRFDCFYRELGITADSAKTQAIYEYRLSLEHPFIDGAEKLLEHLSTHYELYAVSNGTARVQDRRIKDADIEKYFNGIFISQRVGADKPDKAFFDYCFSHIQCFERDKCIIIGDSPSSDIQGGRNAGILTCRFNPQSAPSRGIEADYEIRTLSELPQLLKGI